MRTSCRTHRSPDAKPEAQRRAQHRRAAPVLSRPCGAGGGGRHTDAAASPPGPGSARRKGWLGGRGGKGGWGGGGSDRRALGVGTPVARAKAFQGSAPSLQQPAGEPARGHQQVPAMHLGQSAHLGLLEGWRGVRRHAAAAAALSGPALKEGKGRAGKEGLGQRVCCGHHSVHKGSLGGHRRSARQLRLRTASYCSCPRPATCLHCGHHVAPNGMLQSDCLLAACMHQTEELPPPPPTPPHPPTTPPRSEHDNRRLLLHLGTLAASKAGLSSSRHACGFSSKAV